MLDSQDVIISFYVYDLIFLFDEQKIIIITTFHELVHHRHQQVFHFRPLLLFSLHCFTFKSILQNIRICLLLPLLLVIDLFINRSSRFCIKHLRDFWHGSLPSKVKVARAGSRMLGSLPKETTLSRSKWSGRILQGYRHQK